MKLKYIGGYSLMKISSASLFYTLYPLQYIYNALIPKMNEHLPTPLKMSEDLKFVGVLIIMIFFDVIHLNEGFCPDIIYICKGATY